MYNDKGITCFVWLNEQATSNLPKTILFTINGKQLLFIKLIKITAKYSLKITNTNYLAQMIIAISFSVIFFIKKIRIKKIDLNAKNLRLV